MIGSSGLDGSLLTRLADRSSGVRREMDVALQQQSTGKVSDTYAGLGSGLRSSLDLRPAMQHMQVWQNNIDSATSRMDVTQSALSQISGIAQSFYAATNNLNGVGVSEVSSIASTAKQALRQVAQLLNTKVGDVYVFSGQSTDVAPIPDTDPDVVGAALLASDTGAGPFSPNIGTTAPQVEVGEGQLMPVGVLANVNTMASATPPTTGSYMRDVMRALATLAAMTEGPGTAATADDTRARLRSAIGAMSDEVGALGSVQAGLARRQTTLAAMSTAVAKQVSNAEDVDMAKTLTTVSTLQTQLQASYQMISGVKSLSLANYL